MSGGAYRYVVAVAEIVDFYLGADRATERAEVVRLAKTTDAASRELLKGYVREAQRRSSQVPGFPYSDITFSDAKQASLPR